MSNVAPNHLPLQLAHQKAGDAALFKEHHMVLLGDPSCLQLATQSWMQGAGQTASSPVTTNQPLNLEILVGPELHRVSATRVDRVHVKPIELIVGAPEVDGIVIACDSSCDDTIRKVEQLLFVLAQVRQRSLFKCGFIVDTRYPLPQPNAPTGCLGALKELVELHECQFLALPTASSLDPETNPLMNRTSLAQKHSNLMTDGNSSTADGSSFDMPGNGIPGTSSPIWSRISALHTPSRALRVLEEIVRTLSTTKITLKSDRRLVGKAVLFRDLTPSSLYPVVAMKQPLQSMPLTLASFVEVLHASHRTRRLVLAAPSHSRHLSLVKHVAGLVPGRHRSPSAGTDDGSTELPSLMSLAALEIAATHGGRDRKTDELVAVLATLPDHVNEVVLHEHWSWATIQGLAKRQLRQGTRENRRRSVERKSAAFAKAQTNGAGGVFAAPVVLNKKLQPLVPNGRSQKGQDATAVALDVPTAGLTLRVESVPDVTFVALDWPVCTPTHRGAVQQAAGLHHARGSVGSVLSALRRRGLKGSQSLNVMDAPKQLSAHQTQSAPEMPNVAVSDSTLDEGHLSVSSLEAVK
ncbi:hypothetical protein CAOG_03777 [Capsaspora owczarzaki ATCC 30864]|uniref:hypothetical protein n=1 Tax=Capsaspora owczarzaki (strain ATCC 30864) TaxID=595528 RepID=UPI0003525E09|nr:hypothetical protein CAOG_03777 [Capsaspora owczarzaki ATCC 30864]|eukprot:XP_004363505.2 hypothetical protein CAOG_03777 [Capsaspora owczarzaki ATCC 30864]